MGLMGALELRGAAKVAPESSEHSKFRGDIEGLRAIAVTLVLLYHAGAPIFPGGFIGVDVFFVISGFLITTLLVAEMRRDGAISITGFYARRAKRLLPASSVVLVTTGLLTWLLLPRIRWEAVAQDLLASGLYAVNWTLAGRSVDYLSQADAPSPAQHFWSLAVEEQFYVFWPLLLLLATLLVRPRWGRAYSKRVFLRGRAEHGDYSLTKPLLLAMTLIAVPSFAWSVYLTHGDPGPAYFVTTTRVWELAIGGAVAILAVQLSRMPMWVAAPLSWTGLAAVITTALLLTKDVPFPGSVAAIPVLGTAAVIAGGHAAGRCGPALLLGTAPARWIGKLSYSLYLWHWPLIVIATARLGDLTMQQGLTVAVLSVIPAWLSFRFVEEPARRADSLTRNPMRALQLGYFCSMAGVIAGLLLAVLPTPIPPASSASSAVGAPPVVATAGTEPAKYGAQVLSANPRNDNAGAPVDRVGSITPDPLQAVSDFDKTCTPTPTTGSSVSTCNLGAADAATEVAVAGDSHIQQWLPALRQIAQDRGWAMTVYLHDACPFVDAPLVRGPSAYEACMKWNDSVRELLEESRPSLVITSFSTTSADVATGTMADALRQSWKHYLDLGAQVIVIRDTPAPGINMAECVSVNTNHLSSCAKSRAAIAETKGQAQVEAAQGLKRTTLVDLTDAICPTDKCAPVIGGVLVYRDADHMTATYAASLADRLAARIPKA